MGLDMYLKASRYLSGWKHSSQNERDCYNQVRFACGLAGFTCEGSPSGNISFNVAYWRKANAIHKWFVDVVQEGKDECQEAYVTREQLGELVALCKTVLAGIKMVPGNVQTSTTYSKEGKVRNFDAGAVVSDPSVAIEKLPTASGFFFGGTDYDENYQADLHSTIEQLEAVLNNPAFEGWDFYYQSSC